MIKIKKIISNKIVSNAFWIIVSKIVQSVLSLLVTMISARYLGPANYGLISYAASVVAFFSPIALLGLNNVMVQELINHSTEEGKILGSSITMSILSSVVCVLGVIGFSIVATPGETITIVVCGLYGITMLCQSVELIVYWFQAKYLSKYASLASLCAYIMVSVYKIILSIGKQNIYLFAISNALDFFLIFIILYILYKRKKGSKISFDLMTAKRLLLKSKYYIIPDLMVAIYLQTDHVMIKTMIDDVATGYYSAATSCSTFISFIYIAIINSARPMIYENQKNSEEKFEKSICMLYTVIIYLSVLIAGGISIFSKSILKILFGETYFPAISIMRIVAWMPTFSYLGTVRNIWVLAKNKQNYLWFITMLGALGNIFLNALLIPNMGIYGAAWASVFTQFITNVLITILFKPYRRCGILLLKSINLFNFIRYRDK